MGAFLDDRNVATKDIEELMRILDAMQHFDDMVGHKTNIGKSTVFANYQKMHGELRKLTIAAKKLPVNSNNNMVGHDITANRIRDVQALRDRNEVETVSPKSRIWQ